MEPSGAYAPFTAKFEAGIRYLGLDKTERAKLLCGKMNFAQCKQHDHNYYTWDKFQRDPGVGYLHERLRSRGNNTVENAPGYSGRTPDAPAPLGKTIVGEFTAMLLSQHARPIPVCIGDDETTAYLAAAFQQTGAWEALALARNTAGGCGSVALGFCTDDRGGHWEVLKTAELIVEWLPVRDWIPKQVCRQYCAMEIVEQDDGQPIEKEMVRTTLWTEDERIDYESVPKDEATEDPVPAAATKTEHKLKLCPIVWYQNTLCSDHPDGECDYEDLWRQLDKVDHLQSQGSHSALANADPTLAISDDSASHKRRTFLRKGSKGLIQLSQQGKAGYVEPSGQGAVVAWDTADRLQEQVLRAAACVVMDAEMMRNYDSGEAVQFRYRPMESRCDLLRGPLGRVVVRMAEILIAAAEAYNMKFLRIPLKRPVEGEKPTPHKLGPGPYTVTPEFPSYWKTTPLQAQAIAGMLAAATAGKAVLSQASGAEVMAKVLGVDVDREVDRVEDEKEEEQALLDASMGLPGSVGAKPPSTPGAPAKKPKSKSNLGKGKGSPSQPKAPKAAP